MVAFINVSSGFESDFQSFLEYKMFNKIKTLKTREQATEPDSSQLVGVEQRAIRTRSGQTLCIHFGQDCRIKRVVVYIFTLSSFQAN